jgi:hypothetical protein
MCRIEWVLTLGNGGGRWSAEWQALEVRFTMDVNFSLVHFTG